MLRSHPYCSQPSLAIQDFLPVVPCWNKKISIITHHLWWGPSELPFWKGRMDLLQASFHNKRPSRMPAAVHIAFTLCLIQLVLVIEGFFRMVDFVLNEAPQHSGLQGNWKRHNRGGHVCNEIRDLQLQKPSIVVLEHSLCLAMWFPLFRLYGYKVVIQGKKCNYITFLQLPINTRV